MNSEKETILEDIVENKETFLYEMKNLFFKLLLICRWFFGIGFLFSAFSILFDLYNIHFYTKVCKFLFIILFALSILPPVEKKVDELLKIKYPNILKIIFICLLFSIATNIGNINFSIFTLFQYMLLPIILFLLIYIYCIPFFLIYLFMKKYTKNKQKNARNVNHKRIKIDSNLEKYISKYISQYIYGEYPVYRTFDNEEVSIFRRVVLDEFNYHISAYNFKLKQIIQQVYNDATYQIFKENFEKDNELDSTTLYSLNDILYAYLNTFDENYDYIYYLIRYLKENKVKFQNSNKVFTLLESGNCDRIDIKFFINKLSLKFRDIIEKINYEQKVEIAKKNMIQGIKKGLSSVDIYDIDMMNGVEFENVLGLLFKRMNYKVEITKASGDQGADLIISKKGIRTVVQAKCYTNNVSNKAVQEIVAAITYYGAEKGMVVTNSYFTKGAKELAEANNIILWNRDDLIKKLNMYSVFLN